MSDAPLRDAHSDHGRLMAGLLRVSLVVPRLLHHDLRSRFDLTVAEFGILAYAVDVGTEPVRIGELAARTGLSFSRASRAASALERRGFLERQISETDGRGNEVTATPEGRATLALAFPRQVGLVRDIFADRLGSSETVQLAALLEEVADRAERRVGSESSDPADGTVDGATDDTADDGVSAYPVPAHVDPPAFGPTPTRMDDLFSDLVRARVDFGKGAAARVVTELGIPLSWYEVMRAVHRGAFRSAAVARLLGVTESGAGKLISRLEEAGHLVRCDDPLDARASRLELTVQGTEVLARATSLVEAEVHSRVSASLEPDEVDQLALLLQKLLPEGE